MILTGGGKCVPALPRHGWGITVVKSSKRRAENSGVYDIYQHAEDDYYS
jgi:hypothetical protein